MDKKLVSSWNRVIKLLINLRDAWDKHKGMMELYPNLGDLDVKAQEVLTLSINRASFRTALAEFVHLEISRGGFNELLVPQNNEKEKETDK